MSASKDEPNCGLPCQPHWKDRFSLGSSRFSSGLFLVCVLVDLWLVMLHLYFAPGWSADQKSLHSLFDMTLEGNFPTWWSSTQLLAVGLAAWLIFLRVKAENGKRGKRLGWIVLAVFFLYMAVDDATYLHERVGYATKTLVQDGAWFVGFGLAAQFPSYYWQLVYGLPFLIIGFFMTVFLWRDLESAALRLPAILGLGCYVLAVGLDFADGQSNQAVYRCISRFTTMYVETQRDCARVFEEFMEMFGTSLLLLAFVGRLTRMPGQLEICFKTESDSVQDQRQSAINSKR